MYRFREKLRVKSFRRTLISVFAIIFVLAAAVITLQVKTLASMEQDNKAPILINSSVKAVTNSGWINYEGTYDFQFKLSDEDGAGVDNSNVSVTINGKTNKAKYNSASDVYSVTFSAKDYVGENPNAVASGSSFQLNYVVSFKDLKGNGISINNSVNSTFKYDEALPNISNVQSEKVVGKTGTLNKKWIKFGDKIKVTFNVNDEYSGIDAKKIKVTMMNSVDATIDNGTLEYDKEKGCVTAFFMVGIGPDNILSLFGQPFDFKIYCGDNAGNYYSDNQDRATLILFDNIPPVASDLTIASENSNKTLAKNKDKIDINFNTDEEVNVSSIDIGSKKIDLNDKDKVTVTSSDNKSWKIQYKLDGSEVEDNNILSYKIVIKDLAGNDTTINEKNSNDNVTYYAPIKVNNAAFKSNNDNTSLAKNKDKVTVSFTTTHPVNFNSNEGKIKIAGKDVSLSSLNNDGMNWSAVYEVENKVIEDNSEFKFTDFQAGDAAGNEMINTKQSDVKGKIIYYAPIEIKDTKIVSDNEKDKTKYAKDGDTATVTFSTKHPVTIINGKIADKDVEFKSSNNDGENWSASYKINNGDITDLNNVSFLFTAKDDARNDLISKADMDSDIKNKIQYFAPITSKTSISSDGNNKAYAKNGSKVIATMSANHNVSVTNATIFDRDIADKGGNDSNNLSVSYTIPAIESLIAEGNAKISVDLTDFAGNTLSIKDTNDNPKSAVTYDRTSPKVTILPVFSGFTNKNISYSINYEDTNLDPKGISLMQNGTELISGEERGAITEGTKSFSKQIELKDENTYEIKGTITDLAGNTADSGASVNITIDKTNPKIEATNISFSTAAAFKKGFKISDYFKIDDKNLNNVVCKVTDANKTVVWDINKPITEDGKKTIYLLATDEAGNSSKALTYDLYIDGTAPKILLKDNVSKKNLAEGSKQIFISSMDLRLSLAKLNIGTEKPDKITSITLEDGNGKVKDISKYINKNASQDSDYDIPVNDFGKYKIVVKAEDDVNNIATSEYTFTLKDKSILQKYYDNKPLFYSSISGLIVILMMLSIWGLIKTNRGSKGVAD